MFSLTSQKAFQKWKQWYRLVNLRDLMDRENKKLILENYELENDKNELENQVKFYKSKNCKYHLVNYTSKRFAYKSFI